jgi:tellurite resistance protein
MSNDQPKISFLEFFPVSLFGSIMGLTGLSFAWELAEKTWQLNKLTGTVIGFIAVFFFIVLTITYLLKFFKYPTIVKAEFNNPVSVSFFGTFIISLLLIPGVILPYSQELAIAIWTVGAALMFLFAWFVLRKWLDNQQEPTNALPVWIIPIVGTLDVPIVGSKLPITGIHEICMVYFAIGIVFTIILLPIIISRLLFQAPLPPAIQPTLLIVVAPLALAFSGYLILTGTLDLTASIFYYADLFLLLLFGSKIIQIANCCPFRVGWWGISFPLVAITIASFRYALIRHSAFYQIIPAILLTISTAIILFLLIQTFYKLFTNELYLVNPAAEKATRGLEPAKN